MKTTAEVEEFPAQLAELVKHAQAGHEVVLTQGRKPVAKIIPATEQRVIASPALQIHPLKGHRVLTLVVSQSELADGLFARR